MRELIIELIAEGISVKERSLYHKHEQLINWLGWPRDFDLNDRAIRVFYKALLREMTMPYLPALMYTRKTIANESEEAVAFYNRMASAITKIEDDKARKDFLRMIEHMSNFHLHKLFLTIREFKRQPLPKGMLYHETIEIFKEKVSRLDAILQKLAEKHPNGVTKFEGT